MKASGVYADCPTPFDSDGELDLPGLRRLIDFYVRAGVKGVLILGQAGEAGELSSFERRRVMETAVMHAGGRVPVWVGVQACGIRPAVEQAQRAEALGAQALCVHAPSGNDEWHDLFFSELAQSVHIPMTVREGSHAMAESSLARLALQPFMAGLVLERPPAGLRLARLREAGARPAKVLAGECGASPLELLERGAGGVLTASAFPEIWLRIHGLHASGQAEDAAAVLDRYEALLAYERQPLLDIALRKQLYFRRGLIASDTMRAPSVLPDDTVERVLADRLRRAGLTLRAEPIPVT